MRIATLTLSATDIQNWVKGVYKSVTLMESLEDKHIIHNIQTRTTIGTAPFNNIKIYCYTLISTTYSEFGNVRPGFKRTFNTFSTINTLKKRPFNIVGKLYFTIWQDAGVGNASLVLEIIYENP